MSDKDFQREVDVHKMFLLLSHRAEAIKLRNSVLIASDTTIDIDSILARAETLTTLFKEQENKVMVDMQVKYYFTALKVLTFFSVVLLSNRTSSLFLRYIGLCCENQQNAMHSDTAACIRSLGFKAMLGASQIAGAGLGVFIKASTNDRRQL